MQCDAAWQRLLLIRLTLWNKRKKPWPRTRRVGCLLATAPCWACNKELSAGVKSWSNCQRDNMTLASKSLVWNIVWPWNWRRSAFCSRSAKSLSPVTSQLELVRQQKENAREKIEELRGQPKHVCQSPPTLPANIISEPTNPKQADDMQSFMRVG
eukprot:3032661-Amphidinium_carterae.2